MTPGNAKNKVSIGAAGETVEVAYTVVVMVAVALRDKAFVRISASASLQQIETHRRDQQVSLRRMGVSSCITQREARATDQSLLQPEKRPPQKK